MTDDKKAHIGASCTWGDGPDVLVSMDGHPFICYEDPKNSPAPAGQWKHGFVEKGSFDLTRNQALDLAQQLFRAAAACRALEDLAEYVEHDMAIHNTEVEHMESGVDNENSEASQQQGVSANKAWQDAAAAAEDLLAHLRTKFLRP